MEPEQPQADTNAVPNDLGGESPASASRQGEASSPAPEPVFSPFAPLAGQVGPSSEGGEQLVTDSPANTSPTPVEASSSGGSIIQPSSTPVVSPGVAPQVVQSPVVTTPEAATLQAPTVQTTVFSPEAPTSITGGQGTAKRSKGKGVIIAAVAAVLLALGGSAFVFGYVIPNQPENVWKTGMNRTADELEAFANKIGDPKVIESFNKNKLTISGKYEGDQAKVDLNLNSKFDQKTTDNTLELNASGDPIEQDINLDAAFKSEVVDDSIWPNVYFKVSGFSEFGLESFMPGINEFDGKWISIEQDFYHDFTGDDQDNNEQNFTQEDVASITRDIIAVTNEYLFTVDDSKAVLKMKEFVGVEESEGVKASRYRTEFQHDNAATYCKALVDKVFANESFRRIANIEADDVAKRAETAKEECDFTDNSASSNKVAFKDEIDVWIDKKYKILHKVRLTEDLEAQAKQQEKEKEECKKRYREYGFEEEELSFCESYVREPETGERYVDFGQIYNGKDEIRLFTAGKSDTNREKYEYRADLSVQIKTLIINGRIFVTDKSENGFGTFNIDIKTEPYDGEIDSSKPEGATPIKEVTTYLQRKSEEYYQSFWEGGERLGVDTEEEYSTSGGLLNLLPL